MTADSGRRIPVAPIVVTPEELRQRIAVRDQFFQEIVTQGRVVYLA